MSALSALVSAGGSNDRPHRGSRVISSCWAHQIVRLAPDQDLAFQDAGDSRGKSLRRRRPPRCVHEREVDGPGHVAEEFQGIDHGSVVESDVPRIALARWVRLGPAARGILGGQNVVETFEECIPSPFVPGSQGITCQQPQFAEVALIVKGAVDQRPVAGVRGSRGIDVLGPASLIGLVREDVGDDPRAFRAVKPGLRLFEVGLPFHPGTLQCWGCGAGQQHNRCEHQGA